MADSVVELSVQYQVQDVLCVLTHHLFVAGSGSPDFTSEIAAWQGDPQTAFLDCLSVQSSLVQVGAAKVAGNSTEIPAPLIVSVDEPGTRAVVTSELPANVCQVFTIRTSQGGRRHRGRNFWSGALEGDIDSTGYLRLGSNQWDAIVAYYVALHETFSLSFGEPGDWAVFSRKTYSVDGMTGAAALVTSWQGHPQLHTLRSRRS